MKQKQFKFLDSLTDSMDEFIHDWLASDAAKPLMEQLRQATEDFSEIILGLSVQLLVSNETKKDSLRLLTTGVQASDGKPAYVCHGDSSLTGLILHATINVAEILVYTTLRVRRGNLRDTSRSMPELLERLGF